MDFPTAWRIARTVSPEQHAPLCSFGRSGGGLLCDCAVLYSVEREWCDIHDVHEPGTGFRRCGECGHLYRTGRELAKAWKAQHREARVSLRKKIAARKQPDPDVLLHELPPEMVLPPETVNLLAERFPLVHRSWPRRIWIAIKDWWYATVVVTITPSRIWVCPECAYDL